MQSPFLVLPFVTEVLLAIPTQSPPRFSASAVLTITELGELPSSTKSQADALEELPPEIPKNCGLERLQAWRVVNEWWWLI
jgi:hypothetical protein